MAQHAKVPVLVMAPHLGRDLAYLSEFGDRVDVLDGNDPSTDGDALLGRAEVLLLGYPVPSVVAARAPHLRWVHHTQAGVSNMRHSDLWASTIELTSSRGAVGVRTIAEYAMAGVFYFARGLNTAVSQQRSGQFARQAYHMTAVLGSTLGVVGLGGIGREVARLASALGMRVVATRHSVRAPVHDDEDTEVVLPASQLHSLLEESDFVVVCSQLTEETNGMFDEAAFAAMKPGAVLINVARGEEIDEEAMLAAFQSGRLAGALLDVYGGESTGTSPRAELQQSPNLLLTPHLSTSGDADLVAPAKALFVENLRRYLANDPLLNVVDRQRGY